MNDLLLSTNGDLRIENGDFVIGNSDTQNQSLLLMLPKGSIKEFPDATVGLSNYLESEDNAAMLREIRTRFEGDGMDVKDISFGANGKLNIDADFK